MVHVLPLILPICSLAHLKRYDIWIVLYHLISLRSVRKNSSKIRIILESRFLWSSLQMTWWDRYTRIPEVSGCDLFILLQHIRSFEDHGISWTFLKILSVSVTIWGLKSVLICPRSGLLPNKNMRIKTYPECVAAKQHPQSAYGYCAHGENLQRECPVASAMPFLMFLHARM